MRAFVDGIIYEMQSRGGISRLYSEILPRMCLMDASLEIVLLAAGYFKQSVPAHRHILYRRHIPLCRVFRPYRIWSPIWPNLRSIAQWLAVGDGRGSLWHSTYYTIPTRWAGPMLVTVVDMIHERFSHLFSTSGDERFRQLKSKCILAAETVICISEATKQDVQDFLGVPPEGCLVVPLACSDSFRITDPELLQASVPIGAPFLLYLGMRSHHKNFRLLMEAYARWERGTEIDLIVVGAPWSDQEMRQLEALGISGRVHLVTDADDEMLCQLYNQAIAFVYPSLYEGFGIPLLEAMACGCPIVASRIPSTLEVAQQCPIYFEPTESDDLVAALNIAVTEGRDSARVRAGLQSVKRYSWDETARRTLEVYRAVSNSC